MGNPVNDSCIHRVSCCDWLKEPCSKEKYEKCKARAKKTANYAPEYLGIYSFDIDSDTFPYESVCNRCPGKDICLWSDRRFREKDGKFAIRVCCDKSWREDTFNKLIEMKEKKGDC